VETQAEVFEGQTVVVNLNLGTECLLEDWPGSGVTALIGCINDNQAREVAP
jgi:hypothetical protein